MAYKHMESSTFRIISLVVTCVQIMKLDVDIDKSKPVGFVDYFGGKCLHPHIAYGAARERDDLRCLVPFIIGTIGDLNGWVVRYRCHVFPLLETTFLVSHLCKRYIHFLQDHPVSTILLTVPPNFLSFLLQTKDKLFMLFGSFS